MFVILAGFEFDVSYSDPFESTLWKKGKDNKQFLKRIFLLSQKDFTLKYFIKEDVSISYHIILYLVLWENNAVSCHWLSFLNSPWNEVQASQSCHLHEGSECSFPAREDRPRSRSADLLPAGRPYQEPVCVPREWAGEPHGSFNINPAATDTGHRTQSLQHKPVHEDPDSHLQVIVSAFNAIRATRFAYLQKKHPSHHDNEVSFNNVRV